MEKPDPIEIAKMLRKPEGEFGLRVAEKMNDVNKEIIEGAVEKLAVKDVDRILEIGFGNAAHIKDVLKLGENLHFTGLDFSDTMINLAKESYQREIESGQVSLFSGESSKIPFAAASFDKVFTVNTLYFWQNPLLDLRNIFRVLKPGGLFCLAFRAKSYMIELPFTKYGFTLYEQQDALELMKQAGFKLLETVVNREAAQEFDGKQLYPENVFIVASK